jgi:hypothetical protein
LGRFPRSVEMITHRPVMGSFRNSGKAFLQTCRQQSEACQGSGLCGEAPAFTSGQMTWLAIVYCTSTRSFKRPRRPERFAGKSFCAVRSAITRAIAG